MISWRNIIRFCIWLVFVSAVVYPLLVRFTNVEWAFDRTLLRNLFPAFGLVAFSIMWLHVVGGAFEFWLKKFISFKAFVDKTTLLVFISIILHPLLLFFLIGFQNIGDIFFVGDARYIWFAIIGWFLLLIYDLGRFFKKRLFFIRYWETIKLISTIGFLFIFFHSLGLGSDVQTGLLRVIWLFYGISAIAATIYTYGIKRFLK
jgi:hypothetical protein